MKEDMVALKKRIMGVGFCLVICITSQGISKVLKCSQVKLLNIALADKPFVIVRIKLALKEASAVVELLTTHIKEAKALSQASAAATNPAQESAFIKAQLVRMITPVKEFFTEIRTFSALIEPLLKESIEEKLEGSHLFAFMKLQEGLLPFFEKRIQTREQLKAFAIEFKTLFGDLHDSLSPEVLKKYKTFIAEVKAKRLN